MDAFLFTRAGGAAEARLPGRAGQGRGQPAPMGTCTAPGLRAFTGDWARQPHSAPHTMRHGCAPAAQASPGPPPCFYRLSYLSDDTAERASNGKCASN